MLKNWLWTLFWTVIALFPTWVYLLFRYVLNPVGFWQKVVTLALGLIFLGTLQIIFLVGLVFCLYIIWSK